MIKSYHKLISLEKKVYFSNRIEAATNTSKEIFKIVKEFTSPKSQVSNFSPSLLWINQLANFFADKIKNIQSTFISFPWNNEVSEDSFPVSLTGETPSFTVFPSLSLQSSLESLQKVKSGSPSDSCPAKILAKIAHSVNPIINSILNSSQQSGVVPSIWKKAHILPLLKKLI